MELSKYQERLTISAPIISVPSKTMAHSPSYSPPPPSQTPPPTTNTAPPHPPPTSPLQGLNNVVISPCAACKILRRRCVDKCVLAPYFPPTEPYKFTTAHRVFGAANIIKLLQDLPESQRPDAVSSMVYEANARIRDPVYGCAGAISQLQKQVTDLQAELAKAQAELVNLQTQNSYLLTLICMEMEKIQQPISQFDELTCFLGETSPVSSVGEDLWTYMA